jgi:uncharacterized protein HemX
MGDYIADLWKTLGTIALTGALAIGAGGYFLGYHAGKKNMEKKENTRELTERISALEARIPQTNVSYQSENPVTNSDPNLTKRAVNAAGYADQLNQKQATQTR